MLRIALLTVVNEDDSPAMEALQCGHVDGMLPFSVGTGILHFGHGFVRESPLGLLVTALALKYMSVSFRSSPIWAGFAVPEVVVFSPDLIKIEHKVTS